MKAKITHVLLFLLFLSIVSLFAFKSLKDRAEAFTSAPLDQTQSQSTGWRVYDPNPEHIWNRLYRSLYSRVDRDGREYGNDELDPLLWSSSNHLLSGTSHDQAIKTLDEFLNTNAERLISDQLKRVLLQRDLWSVFDWSTQRSSPSPKARELQGKLGTVIRRLALSEGQLRALPKTYDAAVASKKFAASTDQNNPARAFLPSDLFQPESSWVAVRVDDGMPVALSHVFGFNGRSVFEVFIRLPEGRQATFAYLKAVSEFSKPWIRDRRNAAEVSPNPQLPQFPKGTMLALVRRMTAIDERGNLVPTNIIEDLQIRIHREMPSEIPTAFDSTHNDANTALNVYEFKLSRIKLFAGEAGGLRAVELEEKEFPIFQSHGIDLFDFQKERGEPIDRHLRTTLTSCSSCHFRPGIHSVASRMPDIVQLRVRDVRRELVPSPDSAEVAHRVVKWKEGQENWKRLRALWNAP